MRIRNLSCTALLLGAATAAWGCSSTTGTGTSPDVDASTTDGSTGQPDAGGAPQDSGLDATAPKDSGATDANAPVDASTPADANPPVDANVPVDASTPVDANVPEDASTDANAPVDASDAGLVCATGTADCNMNPSDGCETMLGTDMNCNFCGDVCNLSNATSACMASGGSYVCTLEQCSAGYGNCDMVAADGCETHTATDANNCGSCGNVCPFGPHSTPTCTVGTCGISCASGYSDCDNNPANGCETPASTCSRVLFLGGSPTSNLLAGAYLPGNGWTTTTLNDRSSFGVALTTTSSGVGVGVYASTAGNVLSSTVWSNSTWGAPAAVNASAVARSTAAIDATGGTVAHLTYQDTTYRYWYMAFTGTWSAPQAIGVTGTQYYGPFGAGIAARGANATAAFFDGQGPTVNDAAASDLSGGVWQAKVDLNTVPDIVGNGSNDVIPTAIVSLSAGPELLMIYVDNNFNIMSAARTAGTWSTPAPIPSCTTYDPVALASLPNGSAILAFRGQDGNLYWSEYSGGMWSAVAAFSAPNVALDSKTSPAVTRGIGSDTAEIAYVSGGQAQHARLNGSTWSAPVLVGGSGLTGVAIASTP